MNFTIPWIPLIHKHLWSLWSLLLWRYSRPAWTRSCAVCSGWPCFGRRVGLGDPQRSLPTPTILWFCDLLIRTVYLCHATWAGRQAAFLTLSPSSAKKLLHGLVLSPEILQSELQKHVIPDKSLLMLSEFDLHSTHSHRSQKIRWWVLSCVLMGDKTGPRHRFYSSLTLPK